MYEYIHTSSPVLENVDTDYWPRLRRWARGERSTKTRGSLRFKYPSHQQQLEMRSPEAICWMPFINSEWNNLEIVEFARNLSMRRVLLYDHELGATWYLGDRCYRQLTGDIVIPRNPPTTMSKICNDDYLMICLTPWHHASEFVIPATQAEYDDYWGKVSHGAVIPALTRYVNTDGIGYAAICASQVRIPQPHMPTYRPGTYDTQTSSQSSSQSVRRSDWTTEVTAPGGASITIDIQRPHRSSCPPANSQSNEQLRELYMDARDYARALNIAILRETRFREDTIAEKDAEIERLRDALHSSTNLYRPIPVNRDYHRASDVGPNYGFANQYFGDPSQYTSDPSSHPGISLAMDDDQINTMWNPRR